MNRLRFLLLVLILVLAGGLVTTAWGDTLPTIVVDSETDAADKTPSDGVCATEAGTCTLRAAIQTANARPGADQIEFVVDTIRPAAALPALRDGTIVDGGGEVELDGSKLPVRTPPDTRYDYVLAPHGLEIRGPDTTVRGMIIHSFPGAQIDLDEHADGATIEHNRLGTDRTGTLDRGAYHANNTATAGVSVRDSTGALIEDNVISGLELGVNIVNGASAVAIVRNRIGLSADGKAPLGNDRAGIEVNGNPDLASPLPRVILIDENRIAATGRAGEDDGFGHGILVSRAPRVDVFRNRIGFDAAGERVKGFGVTGDGIHVQDATESTIGGVNSTTLQNLGNVVAAGANDGIYAMGAIDGLKVRANVVGLNADGTDHYAGGESTGNTGAGIRVDGVTRDGKGSGAEDVKIGGPGDMGNVVGWNGNAGIRVLGQLVAPLVEGNTVGLTRDGSGAPNNAGGVQLGRVAGLAPQGPVVRGNTLARQAVGLNLSHTSGAHVSGNTVTGNSFGLAATEAPSTRFEDNTVRDSNNTGIYVTGALSTHVAVVENTLEENAKGIELDGTTGALVDTNEIRDSEVGVRVADGRGTKVRGNAITAGQIGVDVASDGVVVGAVATLDETVPRRCTLPLGCNDITAKLGVAVDGTGTMVRGNRFTATERMIERDEHVLRRGREVNRPTVIQHTRSRTGDLLLVSGAVESADAVVDIYAQPVPGPLGGDARMIATVTPDGHGRFSAFAAAEQAGWYFTAVATSASGTTSEFGIACGDRVPEARGDSDGDGICDEWEIAGVDYDGDDAVDFHTGAIVGRRDLLVELDAVDAPGTLRSFGTLARMQDAFEQGGVRLRFVDDRPELVAGGRDAYAHRYGERGDVCESSFGTAADRAAEDCWVRLGARGAVVRYGLSGLGESRAIGEAVFEEGAARFADPVDEAQGHRACGGPDTCREVVRNYETMAALGGLLGLGEGDDTPDGFPSRLSVMNWPYASPRLGTPLDFARGDGPSIDERAISDRDGIALSGTARTRGWFPVVTAKRGGVCRWVRVPAGAFDFDGDGSRTIGPRPFGVDDPGASNCTAAGNMETAAAGTIDEWARLRFGMESDTLRARRLVASTRSLGAADLDDDGVEDARDVCPLVADPDQQDGDGDGFGDACLSSLVESDLALSLELPERMNAGVPAEAKLTLTNEWPRAAGAAKVRLTLPDGWTADRTEWTVAGVPARGAVETTIKLTATAAGEGEVTAEVVESAGEDADSTPGGGAAGEDDQTARSVTVIEPPQVRVANASSNEGTTSGRTLRFVVTLSRQPAERLVLPVSAASGTASLPGDVNPPAGEVVFEDWETRQVVELKTVPDTVREDDERFTLTVGDKTATGLIRDDDAPLAEGDLMPLASIAPRGLDGARTATIVGDRDVYVSDVARFARVEREAGNALTVRECWTLVRDESGCTPLTIGGEMVRGANIRHVVASADGRALYVVTDFTFVGQDAGLIVLARDPATGALSFASCLGTPLVYTGTGHCTPRSLPSKTTDAALGNGALHIFGGTWGPGELHSVTLNGTAITGASCLAPATEHDDSCADADLPRTGDVRGAVAADGSIWVRTEGSLRRLSGTTVVERRDAPGMGPVAATGAAGTSAARPRPRSRTSRSRA
ncbi:right-handed parallel beta-helix repeat-containing protein [Solirubrobacter phytolaccae]|uniref:Right-handed parallel beta-helix repeat-containing protein n=1 Tax=Solirubrobacter phytolaccae TaxID=1404360 RepID=A0A9X3NIV8_9ACTN|nr:right-handed parallel beta-helix repeat-containing protein [Solirubrobacter phytolaccae]MDA0185745.1 right-handed parallel beta-helix repeat-containing protein [Solirubrobacter phytolaccae]